MISATYSLIDTHCHFNHEQLSSDIEELMTRANDAQVSKMIVVGFDMESSREAVRLASAYPALYASVGIHPHEACNFRNDHLAELEELATNANVVAIGEIGLDYHYDFASIEDQFQAFEAQIELANSLKLPIIVHCREAYTDTLSVVANLTPKNGGVMHCWAGNTDEALRSIELGLHIGFGGLITFKKTDEIQSAAKQVPMDRILLETDSPYMAPTPYRGKRNEPAYTKIVAERLAVLREQSILEIAEATTRNAYSVFERLKN